MDAETLYKAFTHCISRDVFPPLELASYFGMGGSDIHRVQPVRRQRRREEHLTLRREVASRKELAANPNPDPDGGDDGEREDEDWEDCGEREEEEQQDNEDPNLTPEYE